jgi:NAD(P)-dependent dehydrogenase (short-subunit alcohol dehydrogenase family)
MSWNPEALPDLTVRRQAVGADVTSISLDLADRESVASAAAALTRLDRLDALIQNAGVAAARRERQGTRQGFERAMGTNHLGHFALTALAMPILCATPGSRVVPIGSILTKVVGFNLDDLQSKRSCRARRNGRSRARGRPGLPLARTWRLIRRLREGRFGEQSSLERCLAAGSRSSAGHATGLVQGILEHGIA